MNLSLRQLRVLVAVANAGSLTRAAEQLGLTQSAVSVTLSDLEAMVGATLFQRTTRKLTVTAAGRAALALAEPLLAQANGFEVQVRAAAAEEAGQVTFAATAAIAAALGPRLIARFRDTHPQVQVRMLDVAPDAIQEPVLSGEAAFSLGTPDRDRSEIALEQLTEDQLSVITWPGGPFEGRDSVAWQELSTVPTISVRRGGGIRELIDRCLGADKRTFTPDTECRFLATALAMANERLGVLVLPSLLVAGGAGGRLRALPLTDPVVLRRIMLLRLAGRPLPPAARALIAETKRLAQNHFHLA